VDILARVIVSEASIGTRDEQIAVGWTVRNRMTRNNTTRVAEVVIVNGYDKYAHNQSPTAYYYELARSILESNGSDPTSGATHFFSPRSFRVDQITPDPYNPNRGYYNSNHSPVDIGGGREWTAGLPVQNYRPSWVNSLSPVWPAGYIRDMYFKFFKAPGSGYVS